MKIKSTSANALSPSKPTGMEINPSRADVARNAYFIYLNQGSPQGRDVQHWLEAEAQIF